MNLYKNCFRTNNLQIHFDDFSEDIKLIPSVTQHQYTRIIYLAKQISQKNCIIKLLYNICYIVRQYYTVVGAIVVVGSSIFSHLMQS